MKTLKCIPSQFVLSIILHRSAREDHRSTIWHNPHHQWEGRFTIWWLRPMTTFWAPLSCRYKKHNKDPSQLLLPRIAHGQSNNWVITAIWTIMHIVLSQLYLYSVLSIGNLHLIRDTWMLYLDLIDMHWSSGTRNAGHESCTEHIRHRYHIYWSSPS